MNYDPNKNYVFTDQNGNTFTSKGDNGYVWQSITEGVPISVDENGEWHVGPYLNVTPDGIVAHVPQWFKGTDEYKDWNDTWVPQLMAEGTTITADRFRQYEKILKSLGSMGGLRYSLKNDIKSFDKNNLLSQDDVNYFTDSFVRAVAEGQGGDKAKLTIWGQQWDSAADFARHYKDLSKEDLSRAMTSMYGIMNKGKEGTWDDKPEYLRDAVLASRILNYIDDNSQQYGKNNEFDGLLKSSVWQQINRGMTQFMSGISSNSFVGIPARLAYAGLEAGFGSGDFNMRIEDLYNKRLSTGADLGANLEGNDAADVVGTWGGTIGTIAVTMVTMQGFKGWLNGKMLNATSSSLWGKLGTVADTVAFDFFVNDMPIDLMMFAQDSIKYGADKAWFDPENPQPLFGIPFIRRAADNNYYLSGFGPDVPGGLLMNMVGDLIIDLTPKTISIVLNYLDNNFNMRTQATVARVREKVAVANLALQEKLANIPVFGEGWHRFINGMMGTRQSTIITEGRKAAIAQTDMDWYIRAQNVLTLNNHNGMTEVYPRYAKIDADLKINDSITKFQIDANKYGGMGVTRVEWPEINPKTGKIDTPFNEVPSRIPVKVHQGLLDIERLSELKGEVANEGGVLLNPARQKEITELEEKISKLPKDIKDFADRFSEANKRVERMRIELGISTQEWIDSLQLDPRWEKYMTRQALTVGGRYVGTGATPPDAKILNAARKGYYTDNYIDPTIALGLKLEALGRAYAWNETQKFVVAAEIAQGSKVIAGKGSVEIAQRLGQVRQELTERVEMRNEIGYDKAIGSYSDDMSSVRNAFTKINDQLHLPERLSLKSVYDASQNPRIKEMVTDFNNGKITFADGVKDNLGLTDSDAASVIQNTYAYKGMEYRKTDRLSGAGFDKAVEEFEKTADAKGFDPSFRNSSGEIDAGINGLTEKGRKQLRKKASEIDTRARSEWTEASNKAFEEYKAKHDQWLEGMRKYVDEEWNKLTPKQQEADPFARKIYDEYYKKNPEPEFTEKPEYPKSVETDWVHREMADSLSENLVDKPASLDNKIIAYFDPKDKSVYNENNFNYLTRGEVRRKLINDGYDNLDAKTKKVVDKADNAFIQRTTDNIVLYRAEPIVGSTRKIPEVGDKLDTSAWTYTHLLPQETEIYRLGATTPSIKTLTDIRSYLPGIPSGVIYRFHTPEGTPVFHKKAWQAKGTTGEFVLPRNMDMTVTAISRGGRDSKFTSLHGKMVIVDVEVNPNTGVTPKLKQETLVGSAEGGSAEFNVPDTMKDVPEGATIDYNAGMSPDGRAFKYEIEDGKITSMEEITDSEGLSAALTHVGGSFNVPQKFVETMGTPISQAVGRTIMFYRDNMPDIGLSSTFYTTYDYGNWGFVPWPNQSNGANPFGIRVVDGKVEMDTVPVYICQPLYQKGREKGILEDKRDEVASGYKPKNTATLESTPTHENGHSLVNRLGILELNRKIDEGVAPKIKSLEEAMERIPAEIEGLQEIMIKNALESLGMEYNNSNINRMAATVSEYAMKPIRQMTEPNPRIKNGHGEIFSEAMRMYQGNGQNSSPFCLAIVEQMKKFSENHSMAAAPGAVMAKNGLDIPKKMMKDEQYNFPASVKTNKQKAKWLDEWRQKNPYINGKKMFTEADYQKANLWDTFFQKEVRSYDAKSKSAMPEVLVTKNGDFLKKLSADAAKNMVDEIKKASIKGFDEDLASIVLSGNSRDIFNSIQEFIVKRVNKTASEIAKKMPGGATAENMTKARATVWGEGVMKNETISMLQSLSPDAGSKSVVNFVDKLFKEQAEGFASIDALPLDTKNLIEQKEALQARLAKENRYAQKKGKEVDTESPLKGEHTQIISYKQDGEDVYVVITDPVVATLLQKPDQMKENKLSVEAMAYAANFVSRAYRVGTTSANPIAYVRNVLRDPMQATIQGNFNPLNMTLSPDIFYHTLRDYGLDDKTIKTVTDKLYTWSKASGLTQEMRNMGIDTPGNVGYRSRTEKVAKKIRNSDNLATKIIEWGERPLEAWETMFRNQIAQQSFAKNYRRTGDVNKALGQAYFDASNSTTNFSHSIACFKRATGTVPYLSSAINGVRSFWVQFNADPIGMVTRISAGFMVPAMAITAWNLSSEERRKAYMNLPEWYRDGHLVLVDLEGNVFSLPIPEELSQFYGTARRFIEFTQEASPYSIPQILAKGAFGFLPVETDGYFGEDGSINWERGTAQMLSGLMPQAVTAIYEFAFEKDLFTGQDLSDYTTFQRWLNAGTNVLGTGFKNLVNDVGTLLGAPKEFRLGKNTAETLARDLFGVGFDNVKYEFMEYIGNPTEYNYETGKTKQATGLFKENEKLQEELAAIDKDIAFADEEKKAELEELKQKKINDFTERVTSLTNKYLTLYSQAGGLEEWQKEKLVKLLTLGGSTSTAAPDSYQKADSTTAYLNERALAQQRYIDAGLPAGPSVEALADGGSIDLQAAINRFYGVTKQATQDYKNAVENSGMKDVRDRFYEVMQKIYDSAEEQNKQPDYDLIERIQARYLQMVDAAIIPIINQYGINILNNNDFIDAVRRQVNGMIPSDDWRQSTKNAKKFLSTKEFPTATVDVKKWLKQRYTSGLRDRGLDSDPEVTERLESIKADIDAGRMGAAAGKIEDLKKGINKASYYISSKDLQTLNELYNMVK